MPAAEPIRVLHVDDDAAFLELATTFLERNHDAIEVTAATCTETAREALREGGIDCVVSDYDMDGTNGLELLESVRETHPDLPFLLFTGKGSEEIASRAISAGVTDYLQKRTGTEQYALLANRVTNAVRQHRAERRTERGYQALEAASDGIALLDEDGTFVFVNEALTEITGYDADDLLGGHWSQVYPARTERALESEILPGVRESGSWEGESVLVRADGSELLVEHSLSMTDDGTLVCTIKDMMALGGDAAIAPSGSLLREALDAVEDVFYVLDGDGNLVHAGDRLAEVTGYSPAEISEMDPLDFFAPADRDRLREDVERTLAGEPTKLEAELVTKSGRTIPYEFRKRRLTDSAGEVIGAVGIGRDVSEERRRRRRLERQTEQFESFGTVLSHDLRTPLSTAEGWIELAIEEEDVSHLDSALTAIKRVGDNVASLADAMRAGAVSETEPVALAEAFTRGSEGVDFGGSVTVEGDPVVEADRNALGRLAENLLRNAVEHAGPDASVRIGRTEAGFYVEDDGPGIPPEDREEVFEPGQSRKASGGGYGLVSVRQIAMAHGWTVGVEEGRDGGARFVFADVEVSDERSLVA